MKKEIYKYKEIQEIRNNLIKLHKELEKLTDSLEDIYYESCEKNLDEFGVRGAINKLDLAWGFMQQSIDRLSPEDISNIETNYHYESNVYLN